MQFNKYDLKVVIIFDIGDAMNKILSFIQLLILTAIPINVINCRLHIITSERIGNLELKAAIKCVHEYN